MATTRTPGRGQLSPAVRQKDHNRAKYQRPVIAPAGPGLKVSMTNEPGWTTPGLLDHPFYFQSAPLESFQHQHAYNYTDYDTIRDGQFSRPAGRQLIIVQFQTLTVDYAPPWAVWSGVTEETPGVLSGTKGHRHYAPPRSNRPTSGFPDPLEVNRELLAVMKTGTPFRFRVGLPEYWGAGRYELDMLATLRALNIEERAGEPETRYLDVTFTEFREQRLKRKARGFTGGGRVKNLPHKRKPQKGDTLVKLAKYYYGKHQLWKAIALANGARGVGQSGDLYAWAKKTHRTFLFIPAVDAKGNITQVSSQPTAGTEHFDPFGG